ncbi:hypothetical protein CR513_28252, partial [Mucuna pruriens]
MMNWYQHGFRTVGECEAKPTNPQRPFSSVILRPSPGKAGREVPLLLPGRIFRIHVDTHRT